MTKKLETVKGSGNVFRDFGYQNADVEQLKSQLAAEIIRILDRQKLSVRKAAEKTGFDHADFSRIRNSAIEPNGFLKRNPCAHILYAGF